jgi:hypothetical protein
VKDLIIFDGGPELAAKLQECQAQAKALRQSDLSQLEGMGLTAFGDPLVVKSLRVDLSSGQVRLTMRPREVSFVRRFDAFQLFRVTSGNVGVMDQLDTGGPYGDASPYPSNAGTFLVNSTPGTSATTTSTGTSTAVTNILDLHATLGTNILYRIVTVNAPPTIAGSYVEMGPGQLQGRPNTGAFSVVGDGTVGMTATVAASVAASPADVTLSRPPLGGLRGTILYGGAGRKLLFTYTKGVIQPDFQFPTGVTLPGGFKGSVDLELSPPLIDLKIHVAGEIRFNGYFHFEGDISLGLLGHPVEGARFILDSSDGLTVMGFMDMVIGSSHVQGNVSGHGASFLGDLSVGSGGTGVFASVAIDTNAPKPLRIHGDLKIAGYTITTADLTIDATQGTIAVHWGCSWGPLSAEADMTFRFKGDVSVGASFGVGVHTFLGTIHAHFGVSIDSAGNFSASFGPVKLSVNIPHASVHVSVHIKFW